VALQDLSGHVSAETPILLGSTAMVGQSSPAWSPSNRCLTKDYSFAQQTTSRSIAAFWHIPGSEKTEVDSRPVEMPPSLRAVDLSPSADDDTEAALEVARRQCLALLSKVESSKDDLQHFERRRCGRKKPEDAEDQGQHSEDPCLRQDKLDNESLNSALVQVSASRRQERPTQEDFGPVHKTLCAETVLASPLPGGVAPEREDEELNDELLLLLRGSNQSSKKPNQRPRVELSRRHSEPRLQTGDAKPKFGQATQMQILEEAALEQARLEERRRHSAPASPCEAWSGIETPRTPDSVMTKVWSFLTPHFLKDDYVQRDAAGVRRRSQILKARHRQQQNQLFHASSGHLTRRVANSDR